MPKTRKSKVHGRRIGPKNTEGGAFPYSISITKDELDAARRLRGTNEKLKNISRIFVEGINALSISSPQSAKVLRRRFLTKTLANSVGQLHNEINLLLVAQRAAFEVFRLLRHHPRYSSKLAHFIPGIADTAVYVEFVREVNADPEWLLVLERASKLFKQRNIELIDAFIRFRVAYWEMLDNYTKNGTRLKQSSELTLVLVDVAVLHNVLYAAAILPVSFMIFDADVVKHLLLSDENIRALDQARYDRYIEEQCYASNNMVYISTAPQYPPKLIAKRSK